MKTWRLFVAVRPPLEVAEAALDAAAPWRERLPSGRWERPEKMHFTLKFLGGVEPERVGWVRERCEDAAVEARAFTVRLGGLGAFPSPRRARVLWVGVGEGAEVLEHLAAGLDDALAPEIQPEARAYTPHLTLARFRGPVSMRLEDLQGATIDAPPFRVDRLALLRSHLRGRAGSIYEDIASARLG